MAQTPTSSTPSPNPPKRKRYPDHATRSKYLPPNRSPIDRHAVRAASIAGLEDVDICRQHTGLKPATLRQWRRRDPQWSAAYRAARYASPGRRPDGGMTHAEREAERSKQAKREATGLSHTSRDVTRALISDCLPAISERNALRVASSLDRSIAKVEKRKQPLPIATVGELAIAYKTLRLATGQDNDQAPQVQLNIWGSPGLQTAQASPAFRDVGPPPAAAPAGD